MAETMYTPEVMAQAAAIYDKLNRMPPDKRNIAALMADAYISGMLDREHLAARSRARQDSA